jgi:hypothetical protein
MKGSAWSGGKGAGWNVGKMEWSWKEVRSERLEVGSQVATVGFGIMEYWNDVV